MLDGLMWLLAWSIQRRARGPILREERVKILGTALMMCLHVFQNDPEALATNQPAMASIEPLPFCSSAARVKGPHSTSSSSV